MVTDAENDSYALEKLNAINKITKQCIPQELEQDEFILPDLSREKENDDTSFSKAELYLNTRYPRTPLNTRITSSNDKILVIYDLTDGVGAEIPEILYEA